MKKTHATRKGTVLIELVMVAALIGVVVIAMYMVLLYGASIKHRSRWQTRASQIAAQEIEIIRATPWASLTVPYNGAFIGTTDPVTELPGGTANLTTFYHINSNDKLKEAVVTVGWVENGQSKQVQYTTLVVESGVGQ